MFSLLLPMSILAFCPLVVRTSAMTEKPVYSYEHVMFYHHFASIRILCRWCNSPHSFSSEPSRQSLSPSQRKVSGMQRLSLSQRWWQPSVGFQQSSSSERSWHWAVPSHTCSRRIHLCPWAHKNSPGRRVRVDTKRNSSLCFRHLSDLSHTAAKTC